MDEFLGLCVKDLLELQITYKLCKWCLDECTKKQNETKNKLFLEYEQEEKMTEAQEESWEFRRAKQDILNAALCTQQLMRRLHQAYKIC